MPKMDWNNFCDDVACHGGRSTEYCYLGTVEKIWGESDKRGTFQTLSTFEVSSISDSKGSNLQFRGEDYKFVFDQDDILAYEGETRCIVCGKNSKYVLIIFGFGCPKVKVRRQCLKSVRYGLTHLKAMKL
ncbi:uncharacterized protein LOC143452926 isoform X1 [Clavelina lepadiformis]|uniref:uncharacterized protein LOC143452926 isoform X1 n=1 Tax=Clavelina lepadiformis TaxID=159417 RepID=UPI0040427468